MQHEIIDIQFNDNILFAVNGYLSLTENIIP